MKMKNKRLRNCVKLPNAMIEDTRLTYTARAVALAAYASANPLGYGAYAISAPCWLRYYASSGSESDTYTISSDAYVKICSNSLPNCTTWRI